jgi:hypothetical protein
MFGAGEAYGNRKLNVETLCGSTFELDLVVAHGFGGNPNRRLASILEERLWWALRLYRVSQLLGSSKLGGEQISK